MVSLKVSLKWIFLAPFSSFSLSLSLSLSFFEVVGAGYTFLVNTVAESVGRCMRTFLDFIGYIPRSSTLLHRIMICLAFLLLSNLHCTMSLFYLVFPVANSMSSSLLLCLFSCRVIYCVLPLKISK
jgi:hypothetical protein